MRSRPLRARLSALLTLSGLALGAAAAAPPSEDSLNAELREEVVRLRIHDSLLELETTLFRPAGNGPFPLAVINHGKDPDNVSITLERRRARFPGVARELVKRGYLVAIPMRQGFGRSHGLLARATCDVGAYARRDAEDVRGAIDALARRADVDASRIVVLGNSAGGMASVAYAPQARPGVKAIVAFAGGLRVEGPGAAGCWPNALYAAYAQLAPTAGVPQLWVYADNDHTFPPAVAARSLEAFQAAGGQAELLMLPAVAADGHGAMAHPESIARWLPDVLGFLEAQGLPTTPVLGSGFAAADDVAAFPGPSACRQQYKAYLAHRAPKAFALSPAGGGCSWSAQTEHAATQAVTACRKAAPDCRLYAYDDIVVWNR